MSHVDDGKLNALLDGELDTAEADAVRTHIASCADCAKRLDEAKQFLAGAADLLGALDLPATATAPAKEVRRVSKTAKEVAIDLDGATHKTPAIRPNLPEPPAAAARPRFDFTTLAWAAMIVLAIGVGYLANEVRHVRGGTPVSEAVASRPAGPAAVALSAPAQPASRAAASPAAPKNSPPVHTAAATRAGARPAGASAKSAAPPSGKRLAAAPRPVHRQPAHAAANTLASAAGAGARAQEAAPRPAAAAAPTAALNRAGSAAAVAGVTAPSPVPTTFQRVTLEEAVARLDGVIRLMDGMRFEEVQLGPGSLVAGADRGRQLVRLSYVDGAGRRFVLDQQRIAIPATGGSVSFDLSMRAGDTLTTVAADGTVHVRWISGTFWLSLTGNLPADEMRRLMDRVR